MQGRFSAPALLSHLCQEAWVSLRALPPPGSHSASFGLPAMTALGLTRGVRCFQARLSWSLQSSRAGTEVHRLGGI